MADRTRPIVRLEVMNRMVTKGYRKGVYPRVTNGIKRGNSFPGPGMWCVLKTRQALAPKYANLRLGVQSIPFGFSDITQIKRVASTDGRLPHLSRSSTRAGATSSQINKL